jgi:hypothetical protein
MFWITFLSVNLALNTFISPNPDCNKQYCHNVEGSYTYPNGTKYLGGFNNGKPNGKGRVTFSDGASYEGTWANDSPNGFGTYIFNKKAISGYWKDGKLIKRASTNSHEEPIPINAPKPKIKPNLYAIIVGVSSYTSMPSLKYTDDDAYRLYAFLKSPEGGAVSDDRISLLIDESATKSNILKSIIDKKKKVSSNDLLIIYLSGHGILDAFIPYDFDGRQNHLPYKQLLQEINNLACNNVIVVTDACHSGSIHERTYNHNRYDELLYRQSNTSGNKVFITSSRREEVSLEHSGMRQGIFSHYFIEALKGAADFNQNSFIELSELKTFLFKQVSAYTAGKQNPTFNGYFDPKLPIAMVR